MTELIHKADYRNETPSSNDDVCCLLPCNDIDCPGHGGLCYVDPLNNKHIPSCKCLCDKQSHADCPVRSHRQSARKNRR